MAKDNHNSIFTKNIQRGIDRGIISVSDDDSKITYRCKRDYLTSFKNPEEKVRASYFCELVLDYNYPAKNIDIEVTVPRRTPKDRADIVVYDEEGTEYLVIECKKDGITDAEFKQAIEQAFGNANSLRAKFASVVAGITRTAFDVAGFKPRERDKNVISDIPKKYGRTPKYKFIKGDREKDLKKVSREELIRALEKSHDTVWQGGKLAPTTAFDEVSKLLFCKLRDEKTTKKGEAYSFQIGTRESADEIYKRINAIYQKAKKEDAEVFKEDIRLEPKVVYNVVEHLQELAINKIDMDTKGVAFERFMEDFFKGKMGQFFTPREIITFCVEMMNPERGDLVIDPACGSGGFLLNAMDRVRKYLEQNHDEGEAKDLWHKFAMNNLYGIEINDQIARVCKMNMIIHDDGHTNVISTDSLKNVDEITKQHKGFKKNQFDILLTNPPFGAVVKSTEKDYLDKYELGKGKKNQKTEILFIERCLDFLKPNGKMAIVLPDSITINSSLQYVRDYIFEQTQILSIVSLPDIAFVHYGANVKSSLLFLRRLGDKETLREYPVFMALAEKIGYTATGKEDSNELPVIVKYYNKFLKRRKEKLKIDADYEDKVFMISSSELRGRRIDPKGYTKKFVTIKSMIKKNKLPKINLKDCIIKSIPGDWGLDPNIEKVPEGYELCYVLRNTNFDNNFNLDLSDVALRYIESKKIKYLQLKKNEILVEKSGGSPIQPVGRIAIIDNLPDDKPVIFSNFLQKLIVDTKKIDPLYLYSYLKTLYHRGYMEYIQNQTTGIKNLLLNEFYEIQIINPDKKTQEKIGQQYYNDILEVKKRINEAYEMLKSSKRKTDNLILT